MKSIITKLGLFAILACSACNADTRRQNNTYAFKDDIATHTKSKQYIKVALLLDTSNSMDGLIDQAKAQLWEIVNELSYAKCNENKPYLEIALYEYGNDNLNGSEGFIRQVLSFSNDLDEISKHLFSLTTKGGNEYCGQVITTALDQLHWKDNPDDLKLIFIAGNEPFTQGKISYKNASKLASNKDITINTIFCGDYNQGISGFWKDGADLANGNYMAINHNKTTAYVSTPYDNEILEYNKKLNNTYVTYNHIGQQKMEMQAEQDDNAKGYSNANAVSRTVSKSSHLYKNSTWDLVDASDSEDFKYEDLKKDELPIELKGKSKKEIKAYVYKKKEERRRIQEKIQSLNVSRKQFISKQQKVDVNGLENAMIQAIKTQAKHKNYKWD